tara:strand:+ start:544 stop:1746 length:1203 start_codon:yes stop_codon:yes gene_type:complete
MEIVLDNNSTNQSTLDLNFTDLSNSTPNIEINRTEQTNFNEVKNFSEKKPNLTTIQPNSSSSSSSKNVNIGLDLLANPNKVKADTNSTPQLSTIHIDTPNTNVKEVMLDKIQEIKLDSEPVKEVKLDNVQLSGDLSNSNNIINEFDFNSLPVPPKPQEINLTPKESEEARRKKFEDIQKEKFELLCLFERLEKKNIRTIKKFTMNSNIEEMRYEYNRIKKQKDVEGSVAFQRKMLMAFVTGIEFLNNKFDPFDVQLDGWSESIHENLNDYDDIFEELYEKYNSKTKMAPELKLILMVGGSAFMFHLTNTLFKSSLPGMGDIMKQNPELMKQFAKAAMTSMTGNMNQSSNTNQNMNVNDILNNNENVKQRNMEGPPNIDEILKNISNENNDDTLKTINLGI